MVHPQHAAGREVGPEGVDKQLVARGPEAFRDQGRQPPVLPLGIEGVGRRADGRPPGKELLVGPGVEAPRARSQGQVLVKSKRQALLLSLLAHLAQLGRSQPLPILVKPDLIPMLPGKLLYRRVLGMLIGCGPAAPVAFLKLIHQG